MTGDASALWISLPIPALVVDPAARIRDLNPAAEAFMNCSSRSVRDVALDRRLTVDGPLDEAIRRVCESQSPLFISDVSVAPVERPPVPSNLQIAPLAGGEGEVLILVEPREIAGRLGRSMQAKASARSAIGMAEMLAHEIKNPLAGISGAAQLLSMNLKGGDLELTDLIVAETRRIVALLTQVEQFGNLRPPLLKPVNLHDVLDRARKSAVVGFGAHVTIRDDFDPSLPLTHADADQLLQVFLNLLKNACEACPDGSTVTIRSFYDLSLRLRHEDGSGSVVPLQVEIIDDGPGLCPEIRDDMFEPFISGRENGTGLGLALVSKIVSDHGGWIGVESVPGHTVFRVSLPVAPSKAEQG